MIKGIHREVLGGHTERSLSSVVMPLKVNASGFFENGASIIIGSRKYPIDRERGHSWTTGPPEIIPGLTRIAVPNLIRFTSTEKRYNAPVREISITVPFVTFSTSLSKLTS
jgi:hypothetical protein